jgi:energy-coupling factor transport system permease protein
VRTEPEWIDRQSRFWLADLDPRMKLVLVIVCSVSTFMSTSNVLLIINYTLVIILFFTCGLFKTGGRVLIVFCILLSLQYLIGFINNEQALSILNTAIVVIQRLIIFMVMGVWMSSKMRVGDLATALANMRIPRGIIITVAVIFRYMPTLKEEFYYIKSTMKLRGIGINAKNLLLHPAKTIEYVMVPLVIRSFSISNQLAAAAMTRGLDLEVKRTSYRVVKLTIRHMLITVFFVSICAAAFLFYDFSR